MLQHTDDELDDFSRTLSGHMRDDVLPGENSVDLRELIENGRRSGRRRVAARRATTAGIVGALALGIGVLVPQLHGGAVSPAGSPIAGPTASVSRSASTAKVPPAPASIMPSGGGSAQPVPIAATSAEVAIFSRHLSGFSLTYDSQTIDLVSGAASDAAGKAWFGGGMGDDRWPEFSKDNPCTAANGCVSVKVGWDTLRISTDTEKAGHGVWYFLYRPDHKVVWFGQDRTIQGNGPITRATLPLTKQQVIALLSDPAWNGVAASVPATRTYR